MNNASGGHHSTTENFSGAVDDVTTEYAEAGAAVRPSCEATAKDHISSSRDFLAEVLAAAVRANARWSSFVPRV